MENTPVTKEIASKPNGRVFNQETIQALQELGEIFRQVHRRLISEGYTFRDGKFIKPGSDFAPNGVNHQQ